MNEQPAPKCRRCETLEKRVAELEAVVAKLTSALEETRRAGKRQAAPFRKAKKKGKRQKPGRKSGKEHGPHFHRQSPSPDQVNEQYDVPLPPKCKRCSSRQLTDTGEVRQQFQTDVVVSVVVRQFDIKVGQCRRCGAHSTGRHKLQTSSVSGSAGHQFGPWTHAAFTMLNKSYGLSYGKIQKLFDELFNLTVSRSTAARSVLRTGKRCQGAAQQIRKNVRASRQVTPDETGWRVGGNKAWLHAFAASDTVWYEIDPRRNASVIHRLLGSDWKGELVHDGWSPYDSMTAATHQQCTAHLIRRCNELLETAVGGALRFPCQVKRLLKEGLELRERHQRNEISDAGIRMLGGKLTSRLLKLVLPTRKNKDNDRFAWFLYNHLDQIFAYLARSKMDATNWRGEQAIRPAVVNRKVWGGNRTWIGAQAQGVLMSVIQTCRLRCVDPFDHLINTLTSPIELKIPATQR